MDEAPSVSRRARPPRALPESSRHPEHRTPANRHVVGLRRVGVLRRSSRPTATKRTAVHHRRHDRPMDAKHALYIAGAVLELLGILLVSAPDLLPYSERASRWLRTTTRPLVDRLRRAIGRPRVHVVHVGGAGAIGLGGGSVSVVVSSNPEASLEERVEYLMRREQEAQARLNAHDERLGKVEEQLPKRLEELRAETQEHVSTSITAAEWKYRPVRFIGAIALTVGLALTTAGNFL